MLPSSLCTLRHLHLAQVVGSNEGDTRILRDHELIYLAFSCGWIAFWCGASLALGDVLSFGGRNGDEYRLIIDGLAAWCGAATYAHQRNLAPLMNNRRHEDRVLRARLVW